MSEDLNITTANALIDLARAIRREQTDSFLRDAGIDNTMREEDAIGDRQLVIYQVAVALDLSLPDKVDNAS